jgi:aminopeptidase N
LEAPVLSINRNFSAPINVCLEYTQEDSLFLMAHDSDPFNRWEAGQKLATDLMLSMVKDLSDGKDLVLNSGYIEAFGAILNDTTLDNALKSKALVLPSEESLAQYQEIIDFDGNHLVREFVRYTLAEIYQKDFMKYYSELNNQVPYHYDSVSVGKRSLKNVCLAYLSVLESPEIISLCYKQFQEAKSMADQFAGLALLTDIECPQRTQALKAFYDQWKHDTLVMNKWLAIQAMSKLDGTYETVNALMKDPVFDLKIPNLVRALITSFTGNAIHFNRNDGVGYAFLADRILELDDLNPQISAGLAQAFRRFSKLDPMRKKAMKRELQRITAQPNLSKNVYEIVSKSLAWDNAHF